MKRIVLLVTALFTVNACATGPRAGTKLEPGVTRTGTLTTTVRSEVPPGGGFRPPSLQAGQGLEGVIGARAEQLTRSFGAPRIDLIEGDARKLQFSGDRCVLDVFLYPLEPGQTPVATHVEARNPSGGSRLDPPDCVRALAQR